MGSERHEKQFFPDNAKQKEEVKERADKVQSLAERKRVVKKKIFTQAVMPKTEGLGGVEQFNQKNQKLEAVADFFFETINTCFYKFESLENRVFGI
jgi:hypothetical protein